MRLKLLVILFSIPFFTISQENQQDLTQYVNPLIGTDSKYELSNGNTYPAIALPWGMNFWSPQTNKMGNGWAYQYSANKIRGFKQTHQPSPWINDYGAFSIFATTEKLVFDENLRESWFSHKAEVAKPYYYKNYLADYNTTVEITPTERASMFRITYPKTDQAYLIVDAFFKNSSINIFPEQRKITGYSCNAAGGVPSNFKNYFVIYADKPFESVTIAKDGILYGDISTAKGKHVGGVIRFNTADKEAVHLRIASSFIGEEQAELNLKNEIGDKNFDTICEDAKQNWNNLMKRVTVSGGTNDELTNFYTALYRTLLFPRKFYEIDKNNQIVHYSPYNGKIEKGYLFTDNGFWDTFRAVFPFFALCYPDMSSLMMEGLANTYKESGWLPEWASPGHRDCMIGSNSASIISDALAKGVKIEDKQILFDAILKNTTKEGPMSSVGRLGVEYYNQMGYIPYDVKINENVARTLEYSYDDFTAWKMASILQKPKNEQDTLLKRAFYYKNVFDKSTNFMRGRNKDGSYQTPFRADKWGDAFTEGNAWHWTWCVFHDINGLIQLMGGKRKFIEKLDSTFIAAPTFDYSYYGSHIHEITEMLIINMGQYAHGNQPIQHMPYLYNYAGQPWKSQQKVREIMQKLYKNAPDGLCGDEDNGQTSAWYVFSAMGFYPVCPGSNQYVLGSPIFNQVSLNLQNGKRFDIVAKNNSIENVFSDDKKLNGKDYKKLYISHHDIMNGGKLEMEMKRISNKNEVTEQENLPYSLSIELEQKH